MQQTKIAAKELRAMRKEIRFHGRGGQGAKTAADLLARAAVSDTKFVRAFPEYGPERAGAPVTTFVRISDERIKTFSPITKPDIVVVLDETLLDSIDICHGLDKKGLLLINSSKKQPDIKKKVSFKGRIQCINASAISIKHLNINLPNIPILGALVRLTNIVNLENLLSIITHKFKAKIGKEKTDMNIEALKEAYAKIEQSS